MIQFMETVYISDSLRDKEPVFRWLLGRGELNNDLRGTYLVYRDPASKRLECMKANCLSQKYVMKHQDMEVFGIIENKKDANLLLAMKATGVI